MVTDALAQGTVADWIGAALARDAGVRTVFGVVGSGNFHVTNALTEHGARFVPARHEGGAAVMADAYARVSGELGVLTVHQGPGLTNALTGLTEAAKSRTPLLVLAAEATQPTSNFYIDQAGLAAAIGVLPDRVTAASTVANDLRRAYRTALIERRTVLLSLPLDVQAQPHPDVPMPAVQVWPRLSPAPDTVAQVADVLARARRPVFLAGRGARKAKEDLKQLSERVGALLATSAVSRGLFNGDPFNLDVSGGFATPAAAELITGADLVIAWGCALSMWTTRHGTLIGDDATVIQVDANPGALGVHHRVDLGIPSDVATAARALIVELDRRGQRAEGYRTPAIAEPPGGGGPLARRPLPARSRSRPDRPPHPHDRPRRPATRRAHRGDRLGELHGLPGHVPRGSRRARLRLHPGVPVRRPWPGHRARRRHRPPGPPHGRGPRRRRRPHGRERTGDRGPPRPE